MRIIVSLLLLSCISCGADSAVESKREHWSRVTESLNAERPARTVILEKYSEFVVPKGAKENELFLKDTLELNNLVCKSWSYMVQIIFEESGVLESARMTDAGMCL